MEFDDKVMALAKHLKVDPALIEGGYSHYYTVNGRTVKEGKTPEDYNKLASDFRFLLNEEMQELITDAIVNPHPPEKLDEVYSTVSAYLEPIGEKAKRRAEQMARLSYKPAKETIEDVYNRLQADNLYVVNPLYYLVKADGRDNTDHVVSLRRAWLGQPVSDTRRDRQVDDGEYLVMTDSEADDWEEEGLRSLFQDMTSGVEGFVKNYLDEERFVEENSGNRGENINGYDGTEEEVEFEGTTYYIYRNN